MCGRYVLAIEPETLQQAFNLTFVPEFAPHYNIAPTQNHPIIPNETPDRAELMRWGLIPSWAKDRKIGASLINARSESAAEKPSFRSALKRRRCLVPATGYYEWQERGGRVPIYIQLAESPVFAMAGLWEMWESPETGETVRTYTILTTEANAFIRTMHHRMPVILHPRDHRLWLEPGELTGSALAALLRPYEGGSMTAYEVSTAVNRPVNDFPQLIEPVG